MIVSQLQQDEILTVTAQVTSDSVITTEFILLIGSFAISLLSIVLTFVLLVSEIEIKGKINGEYLLFTSGDKRENNIDQLIGVSIISLLLSLALVMHYYLWNKSKFNVLAIIMIVIQLALLVMMFIGKFTDKLDEAFKFLRYLTSRSLTTSVVFLLLSAALLTLKIVGQITIQKSDAIDLSLMLSVSIILLFNFVSQFVFWYKNKEDKVIKTKKAEKGNEYLLFILMLVTLASIIVLALTIFI